MNQQPNKKAIGLFFVLGIIILILILGQAVIKRLWGKDTYMSVMYFEESTQGLSVGAPVLFNGVEMGKVVKISLEANPKTFDFQIPVYVELTPISTLEEQSWRVLLDHRGTTLKRLIKMGLRAKLKTQSYLTGQLMIEMNIEKDAPLRMVHNWLDEEGYSGILEIPTVISASGKLSQGLDEMQFSETFDKINTILDSLDRQLPQLLEALTKSAENMEKITHMVSTDTVDKTSTTLTEISETMRSVRNLTDYLEQYPESLLKGKR